MEGAGDRRISPMRCSKCAMAFPAKIPSWTQHETRRPRNPGDFTRRRGLHQCPKLYGGRAGCATDAGMFSYINRIKQDTAGTARSIRRSHSGKHIGSAMTLVEAEPV